MFDLNKFAKEFFGRTIERDRTDKIELDAEIDLSHQNESPKMTEKIENEVFSLWEERGWHYAKGYLEGYGFDAEEIDLMYEQWLDGKSMYPF